MGTRCDKATFYQDHPCSAPLGIAVIGERVYLPGPESSQDTRG